MTARRRTGDTKTYTRDELLEAMQNFIVEAGRLPTSRDADTGWHGLPTVGAFVREFGSWRNAVAALGMSPDPRGGHNKGAGKSAPAKTTKTVSKPGRLRPTKG